MRDADQLQAIDEQRLLELVGDAEVVAAVALAQLARAESSRTRRSRARRARPGAAHAPISPPPMKSVTNSNRVPFHV